MKVSATGLPGVVLIEPDVFGDERGSFHELWHDEPYRLHGLPAAFSQANLSRSRRGVVRGLHYQWPAAQGKLVQVVKGSVFDVAVDIRRGSPDFARWVAFELSAENHRQLWIPEGFAHGFQALEDDTVLLYFCTLGYRARDDRALAHDDPEIEITWPLEIGATSARDAAAPRLAACTASDLPVWK